MKENKLLKMQSLVILTVMILHILLPIFPLSIISRAEEEQDLTSEGSGTEDDPWKIGKDYPSEVMAYVKNNTLRIYANGSSGAMKDFDINSNQWGDKRLSIKTVNVEQGVIRIGAYTFYNCKNLTTINISKSVNWIAESPFEGCEKLQSIYVAEGNLFYEHVNNGVLYRHRGARELVCYPAEHSGTSYSIISGTVEINKRRIF